MCPGENDAAKKEEERSVMEQGEPRCNRPRLNWGLLIINRQLDWYRVTWFKALWQGLLGWPCQGLWKVLSYTEGGFNGAVFRFMAWSCHSVDDDRWACVGQRWIQGNPGVLLIWKHECKTWVGLVHHQPPRMNQDRSLIQCCSWLYSKKD